MKAFGVALLLVACSREHVDSCASNLRGVWRDDSGARWMMLDNDATLEAYPMQRDTDDAGGAPRVLDLTRREQRLDGELHRRYIRGPDICEARSPVHVTACRDDTLELVTSDLSPPLGFAPCRWPSPTLSHVDHWHRRE